MSDLTPAQKAVLEAFILKEEPTPEKEAADKLHAEIQQRREREKE